MNKKRIGLNNKTIFVTGAAGYIGYNLITRLMNSLYDSIIIGVDNLNDYYDPEIKRWRLKKIEELENKSRSKFIFIKSDISESKKIDELFAQYEPKIVVNLAAQVGVRYSILNPDSYIKSNIIGFYNILEACRHSYEYGKSGVEHLVYASSSSVYGENVKIPFSTEDKVDNPVSLYAATKKSNELMAYSYSKLYNIPSTGLRFFTVIGGETSRPDMSLQKFTDILCAGGNIKLFNYGNCKRDYTNVNDIVEAIQLVMAGAPERKMGEDELPITPYCIYNIGHGQPDDVLEFVTILQEELVSIGLLPTDYNFDAHKEFVPMQKGDVPITFADTTNLERDYDYKPKTDIRTSIKQFLLWYKEFYHEHKKNPFND